jgi:hypothetical protein
MHRLLGSLEAWSPAADQDILERLLEGRLDPASAPPRYCGLARLLAAATAPAAPEELAGEPRVMAEFTTVLRSRPPTLSPRRTPVPTKVFTIKAAAAALVAVLSLGGIAAAATGLLPDQASPVAEQATATTAADAAAHGLDKAAAANLAGTAHAGSTEGHGREAAVGPDATGAARVGLCRAWQAGQGGADHGRRMDAVAFQALADAAGGADQVAAYCEDVTAGASADAHGQGQGSPSSVSAPSTSVAPPSSGPAADPGPPDSTGPGGHGQGGPPTTTG